MLLLDFSRLFADRHRDIGRRVKFAAEFRRLQIKG